MDASTNPTERPDLLERDAIEDRPPPCRDGHDDCLAIAVDAGWTRRSCERCATMEVVRRPLARIESRAARSGRRPAGSPMT